MSFFPYVRTSLSSGSNRPAIPTPLSIPTFPRPVSNQSTSTTSSRSPGTPSGVSSAYSRISSASTRVPSSPSGTSFTHSGRASISSSYYSSIAYRLEIISFASSSTPSSPYFSLSLCVRNHPTKTQDAIYYYSEATARYYSPILAANTTTLSSPVQPTSNNSMGCIPGQHDMIKNVLFKAPQYIFRDSNFGNPWYILEIRETQLSEPHFNLVARYSYQLLISGLKETSQLYLRKSDGQKRHYLYERFGLTYIDKLGMLACTGYLGEEDDIEVTPKLVFIKTLNLDAGPEKNGEPVVDMMEQANGIYEEINLLNSLPMHPNLTPAPIGYITLGSGEGAQMQGRKIIGYVNRYYENGRLSDYLFLSGGSENQRIPRLITVLQKAKWALQITSVMLHIHRKAGISVGDGGRGFGLERFLVDEYMQLHLGGFSTGEKVTRTSWRVPPEARVKGEWGVEEIISNRDNCNLRKLVWTCSHYVRLRWEQDNLGTIDDMDPFLTPLPSPTASHGSRDDNSINKISGSNSTSSKSTIGRVNKKNDFSAGDGGSYHTNKGSNTTEAVGQFELRDVHTIYSMEEKMEQKVEKEITEERKEDEFSQKKWIAINDKNWSAFEEWRHIPKATEIVETYSLGVMLWLLFEQIQPDNFSNRDEDPIITWSAGSRIPKEWRAVVEACVERDPTNRIGMEEVLGCFVGEVGRRWDGGWLMG